MSLDTNSRDADIAGNISNFSSVEFPLDFLFFNIFRGATFTSLRVNLIVTIRRHLEPRLLRPDNSTGVKTSLVQK